MFNTKPKVFSIGTIVVHTSIWSNQLAKLITSARLNLVKQVIKHVEPMSEPHASSNIHVKLVHVQFVKIVIPHDTFQQHLPKTFFQPEVREMEINVMLVQIRVQNLRIVRWTITREQLTKINLCSEKNLQ
jgi:hypothetical protein